MSPPKQRCEQIASGQPISIGTQITRHINSDLHSIQNRERTGVPAQGSPARQPRWGGKGAGSRLDGGSDRICHSTFWNAAVASTGAIPNRTAQPPPTCRSGRGQSGARPRSSCKATQLYYPQHCGNSSLSLSLPIAVPTPLLSGLSGGALRFAPFPTCKLP